MLDSVVPHIANALNTLMFRDLEGVRETHDDRGKADVSEGSHSEQTSHASIVGLLNAAEAVAYGRPTLDLICPALESFSQNFIPHTTASKTGN